MGIDEDLQASPFSREGLPDFRRERSVEVFTDLDLPGQSPGNALVTTEGDQLGDRVPVPRDHDLLTVRDSTQEARKMRLGFVDVVGLHVD